MPMEPLKLGFGHDEMNKGGARYAIPPCVVASSGTDMGPIYHISAFIPILLVKFTVTGGCYVLSGRFLCTR
jgi:hypothetical protein